MPADRPRGELLVDVTVAVMRCLRDMVEPLANGDPRWVEDALGLATAAVEVATRTP